MLFSSLQVGTLVYSTGALVYFVDVILGMRHLGVSVPAHRIAFGTMFWPFMLVGAWIESSRR